MKQLLDNRLSRSLAGNRAGFTMIELLIVVGIVGMLGAVGIPQYRLQQARARQGEVKAGLTTAYTSLQNFAAEASSFTICLQDIGITPGAPTSYYAIGIAAGRTTALSPGNFYDFDGNGVGVPGRVCVDGPAPSANIPIAANAYAALSSKPTTYAAINTLTLTDSLSQTGVSTDTFRLGAEGSVANLAGLFSRTATRKGIRLDSWTINQNKELVNVQNGLADPEIPETSE